MRAQVLGEALAREANYGIGGCEDGLCRPVVLFQGDERGWRGELLREIEDVAHGGSAKPIDRLGVISDHSAIGLEAAQDRCLQGVGVLVLIDENMVEQRADLAGKLRHLHQLGPVEQEVVVIENMLLLLGRYQRSCR